MIISLLQHSLLNIEIFVVQILKKLSVIQKAIVSCGRWKHRGYFTSMPPSTKSLGQDETYKMQFICQAAEY